MVRAIRCAWRYWQSRSKKIDLSGRISNQDFAELLKLFVADGGWFKLGERGTTVGRELRGGVATFFTMAYIIVLNPIILSLGKDYHGHTLSFPQLSAATALVAEPSRLVTMTL